MTEKRRSDQAFGGAMLIGLGILFWTHWWWPGILFVVGIAMAARSVSEGRRWAENRGTLWMLGIGAAFLVFDTLRLDWSLLWPLVLIAGGVFLLYGNRIRSEFPATFGERPFDEEKPKQDGVV